MECLSSYSASTHSIGDVSVSVRAVWRDGVRDCANLAQDVNAVVFVLEPCTDVTSETPNSASSNMKKHKFVFLVAHLLSSLHIMEFSS